MEKSDASASKKSYEIYLLSPLGSLTYQIQIYIV